MPSLWTADSGETEVCHEQGKTTGRITRGVKHALPSQHVGVGRLGGGLKQIGLDPTKSSELTQLAKAV